jgi:hypothetical protein
MVARDDEMIPATHGRWLADHIPRAELVTAPGTHLGFDRHAEEEKLIAWLATADQVGGPDEVPGRACVSKIRIVLSFCVPA